MMEDLFRKIPLITKIIFEELDDQSFVSLKDASREIIANLKKERFYWIRVLRVTIVCTKISKIPGPEF